ncbi:hypothetical protein [Methylosinus trichosporium]|uniref:hypothetical protein n=1 Tax=Methylosinus trichosporium TaxID=426 RepID=UPI0024BBCA4F|nr:hypothetical protein [Methylosinus trichosporium]
MLRLSGLLLLDSLGATAILVFIGAVAAIVLLLVLLFRLHIGVGALKFDHERLVDGRPGAFERQEEEQRRARVQGAGNEQPVNEREIRLSHHEPARTPISARFRSARRPW